MSFFDRIDALGIIELHLQKIQKLEEKQADQLLKVYRRVRQELRDRLDHLPEDTFTAQQIRGVLLQVETALIAMESGLLDGMTKAARDAARVGVQDLITEIKRFQQEFEGAVTPINIDVLLIALDTQNFLINRYEVSLKAYTADVRQRIAMGLVEAVASEQSTGVVIQRMSKFFTGEEWKLRRIARTELHHVYNIGKINGMKAVKKDFIPDLKKTLIHPMDHRTGQDSKQAALQDLVVNVNKEFVYKFTRTLKSGEKKTETRRFMTPPDRPNDRSVVVPYRDDWDK